MLVIQIDRVTAKALERRVAGGAAPVPGRTPLGPPGQACVAACVDALSSRVIQLESAAQRGTRFRLVAGATLLPPGHTRRHDSLRSTTYTFRCAVGTITISR